MNPSLFDAFDRAVMNDTNQHGAIFGPCRMFSISADEIFVVLPQCFFFCSYELCEPTPSSHRDGKADHSHNTEDVQKEVLNSAFPFTDNALHSLWVRLLSGCLEWSHWSQGLLSS